MRRITKAKINKALSRKDDLRRAYRLRGETGVVSNYIKTFAEAYMYVEDDDVTFYHYGYDDAKDRKVVEPQAGTASFDVTDIITEWLKWDSEISRSVVVDRISDMINAN